MGGTGNKAAAAEDAWPATCTQVHTRAERRGQPGIAGNDESQASRSADPGQIVPERRTPRLAVMAQHHTRQTTRQARHRWTGIGQTARIGEQPEAGKPRLPPARRVGPGEKTPIHRASGIGVLTGRQS